MNMALHCREGSGLVLVNVKIFLGHRKDRTHTMTVLEMTEATGTTLLLRMRLTVEDHGLGAPAMPYLALGQYIDHEQCYSLPWGFATH